MRDPNDPDHNLGEDNSPGYDPEFEYDNWNEILEYEDY